MMQIEQRFLSAKEIAVYLGLTVSGVRKWIRQGRIPFNRLNGRIRFDLREVDRWADRNKRNIYNA